ncbi:hypothetical protein EJB05_28944, partial [Eragrostis curvula]
MYPVVSREYARARRRSRMAKMRLRRLVRRGQLHSATPSASWDLFSPDYVEYL